MSTCNVQLRVLRAHDLPKTDLFSQIDPYVRVLLGSEELGRTIAFDNEPNPQWGEDFYFEAEDDEGVVQTVVTLELWDEEVTRDEYVGCVELDMAALGPDELMAPLELPLQFRDDKRGRKFAKSARNARLVVQVMGMGKAFTTYAAELAEVEAARVDEDSGTFLLPVPDTEEQLYAGMRFGPRGTHLLLCSTADPKDAHLAYDLTYPQQHGSLRVERVVYRKPCKLLDLRVWTELRATNVPLDAKLSKVRIVEREKHIVDTLEPTEVLASVGYMIGMPFLAAVKELSKHPSVTIDTPASIIWVRMDASQPQPMQVLQLDYGPGATPPPTLSGVDKAGPPGNRKPSKLPALRVCSTSSELNKGYQLEFFGGGGRGASAPLVTVTDTHARPLAVLGGAAHVLHVIELRDAFLKDGNLLNEVGLGVYEVGRTTRRWRLSSLLAHAPPEEEAPQQSGRGLEEDGGGGVLARVLAWLPCFAPPREAAYAEDPAPAARVRSGDREAELRRRKQQEQVYGGRAGRVGTGSGAYGRAASHGASSYAARSGGGAAEEEDDEVGPAPYKRGGYGAGSGVHRMGRHGPGSVVSSSAGSGPAGSASALSSMRGGSSGVHARGLTASRMQKGLELQQSLGRGTRH